MLSLKAHLGKAGWEDFVIRGRTSRNPNTNVQMEMNSVCPAFLRAVSVTLGRLCLEEGLWFWYGLGKGPACQGMKTLTLTKRMTCSTIGGRATPSMWWDFKGRSSRPLKSARENTKSVEKWEFLYTATSKINSRCVPQRNLQPYPKLKKWFLTH